MDIEENIGTLEEFRNKIKSYKYVEINGMSVGEENRYLDTVEKSIKNIISEYNRQKEINEEHQKENGELRKELERITNGRDFLFEQITAYNYSPEMLDKILRQKYISKDKIKAKIDENMKKLRETTIEQDIDNMNYYEIRILILQELLKD